MSVERISAAERELGVDLIDVCGTPSEFTRGMRISDAMIVGTVDNKARRQLLIYVVVAKITWPSSDDQQERVVVTAVHVDGDRRRVASTLRLPRRRQVSELIALLQAACEGLAEPSLFFRLPAAEPRS